MNSLKFRIFLLKMYIFSCFFSDKIHILMIKTGVFSAKICVSVRIIYLCILKDGSVFPRENTSTVFTEKAINHPKTSDFYSKPNIFR